MWTNYCATDVNWGPGKETTSFPCVSRAAFGLQSNTGQFDANTPAFLQFWHIWRDTILKPQHHLQSWEQMGELERNTSARAHTHTQSQTKSQNSVLLPRAAVTWKWGHQCFQWQTVAKLRKQKLLLKEEKTSRSSCLSGKQESHHWFESGPAH